MCQSRGSPASYGMFSWVDPLGTEFPGPLGLSLLHSHFQQAEKLKIGHLTSAHLAWRVQTVVSHNNQCQREDGGSGNWSGSDSNRSSYPELPEQRWQQLDISWAVTEGKVARPSFPWPLASHFLRCKRDGSSVKNPQWFCDAWRKFIILCLCELRRWGSAGASSWTDRRSKTGSCGEPHSICVDIGIFVPLSQPSIKTVQASFILSPLTGLLFCFDTSQGPFQDEWLRISFHYVSSFGACRQSTQVPCDHGSKQTEVFSTQLWWFCSTQLIDSRLLSRSLQAGLGKSKINLWGFVFPLSSSQVLLFHYPNTFPPNNPARLAFSPLALALLALYPHLVS